jgi:PleD family two-component response regulator
VIEPAGYQVVRTVEAAETLEVAASAQPDIILIDVGSPERDGVALCRRVRHDPAISRGTPVVLVGAAPTSRAVRLAGLRAGAWDVVAFPLDAAELMAKLGSYLQVKREGDVVRAEGLVDQVSGLYGARGISRRALELWADASRRRFPLACVVFAADVQTEMPGGDTSSAAAARVHRHLGRTLQTHGRLSDIIGRWDESEFALLAPGTNAAGAATLAQRLTRLIEREPLPPGVSLPAFAVRAGYEALDDAGATPLHPPDLLARAHAALQAARAETTHPSVRRYTPEPPPQAS